MLLLCGERGASPGKPHTVSGRFRGPFRVSLSATSLGTPSILWLPCQGYCEDSSPHPCVCTGSWAPGHCPPPATAPAHRTLRSPELSVTPTPCPPRLPCPRRRMIPLFSVSPCAKRAAERRPLASTHRGPAFAFLPCGHSSLCLFGSLYLVPAAFLCLAFLPRSCPRSIPASRGPFPPCPLLLLPQPHSASPQVMLLLPMICLHSAASIQGISCPLCTSCPVTYSFNDR